MKYIILTLCLVFSYGAFSQILDKNNLKQIDLNSKYSGKIIVLNKANLIRFKTYSTHYIQTTYIHRKKRIDLRLYAYFDILTNKITPAISIRFIMP